MIHIKWCGLFDHGKHASKSVIETFKGKTVKEVKGLIQVYIDHMADYGCVLQDQEIMDIWES